MTTTKNHDDAQYRIGLPASKPRPLFRALPLLGAGATGALYSAIVAKAMQRRGRLHGEHALAGAMGAGALLGVALAGAGAMLAGTPYDYDKYKVPTDGKPVVVAFSGANGGVWKRPSLFDAKHMPSKANYDVQALDKLFGKGNYALFAKDDVDAALEYVSHLPKGTDIRVIGHSMGGPAAYELARRAEEFGIRIKRLDTLDPVGTTFGASMGDKPVNVGTWNNYIPKDYDNSTYSNLIARLGGPLREVEGARNKVIDGELGNHVAIRYAIGDERGHRAQAPENIPLANMPKEASMDEKQDIKDTSAYATDSYQDYIKRRDREQRDREVTSSVNALAALGATAGTGMLIAGRDKSAATALGGVAGGAGGYHLARMAKAPMSVRLLAAAVLASGGAYAGSKAV